MSASHARPPEVEEEPLAPLTSEQAKTLLEATVGYRFEYLFKIGLALGLRRSELCGLRWGAVDLEGKKLIV